MLQTHRSAIVPIQLDARVILWDWVELAVNAPFFMLEIASPAEDDEFLTHIMTSNLNVLRTHAGTSEAGVLKPFSYFRRVTLMVGHLSTERFVKRPFIPWQSDEHAFQPD